MARTLTADGEQVYVSFPIEKTETTADGDVLVYGKATDGSVDSDMQIVDPVWSAKALQHWLETGGNVRVMHNGQRDPAGRGLTVETTNDGHYVKALIVEPVAKNLVNKGVLRAFSVGIVHPKINQDPTGKAMGGIITGGPLTEISELSLVDRPANRNCAVQLVKSERDGSLNFTGKVFGGDTELLAVKHEDGDDMNTTLTLPSNVNISFTPSDLAKIVKRQQVAEKRDFDPSVGGGVDRDKLPEADFAGRNRSFPIHSPGDVSDAAASIGRAGSDNFSSDRLKANIKRIAHRKGPEFVAQLPKSWQDETSKVSKRSAKKSPKKSPVTETGVKEDRMDTDLEKNLKGKKATCPSCGSSVKASSKFCPSCGKAMTATKATASPTPGKGVEGESTKPVPAHREPDGPFIESLEHDMKIPTVPDDDLEQKTVMRLKSLNVPYTMGALHDALCPAYHPDAVAKSYPHDSIATIDIHDWQLKAMDAAAGAPLDEARRMSQMWQYAIALKSANPLDVAELQHVAHKAFRDANPGPGDAPTPSELSPRRFNRPYLSAGHAAASPGHGGPNDASVPAMGGISAADYTRGFIGAGHAADSPANTGAHRPVSPPSSTGVPSRVGYQNMLKDNADQAMRAMHDHIAQTFPDICAIGPGSKEHSEVRHPVPTPTGTPSTSAIKTAGDDELVTLEKRVASGALTVAEALVLAKAKAKKTKKPVIDDDDDDLDTTETDASVEDTDDESDAKTATKAVTVDLVKSAILEATGTLKQELDSARKLLKKQAKQIHKLAAMPDTSDLPYRGAVTSYNTQAAAHLDGVQKMASTQERTQVMIMQELEHQFRNTSDPAQREAAWRALINMRGIPTN